MISTICRGDCRTARHIRSSELLDRPLISITETYPRRTVSPHQSETPAQVEAALSAEPTHTGDKSPTLGWIKFMRSDETRELTKDAAALGLMAIIALRARWRASFNTDGLKVGEALIGDHKNVGLTRQAYRTRVNRLETWGLITTRPTNKGTIVTINNRMVFDVFGRVDNHRDNQPATIQQPPDNQPVTTNEEGKKDKKGRINRSSSDSRFAAVAAGFHEAFEKALRQKYARTDDDSDRAALAKLLAVLDPDEYPPQEIIRVMRAAMARSEEDRFAKACKLAATLRGFCRAFNEIRAELSQGGSADGHAGPTRPNKTMAASAGKQIKAWLQAVISSRPQYRPKLEEWRCWDDLPPMARKEFLDWQRGTHSSPGPACAPCPDSPEANPPSAANFQKQ